MPLPDVTLLMLTSFVEAFVVWLFLIRTVPQIPFPQFLSTAGGITNVPAPASAGKPVTVSGPPTAPQVHGTVNAGSANSAQVVFDNPA
jgi:hypothetical protein